jgi:hypothetical protein
MLLKLNSKIKSIISSKPITGSLLVILLVILGAAILHTLTTLVLPDLGKETSAVLMVFMRIVIALGFVAWLGWGRDIGLTRPKDWRNLKLLLLLVPLPCIPLIDGVQGSDVNNVLFLATAALFIAVSEEILYRGILLRTLQPLGIVKAVLGLAVLFGAIHIPNVFVGSDPGFELMRLSMTIGGAIGLAVIRIRTNMLWGVIAAHWGLDFTEYLAAGGIPALGARHDFSMPAIIIMIAYNLMLGGIGLFILLRYRKSMDEHVDES